MSVRCLFPSETSAMVLRLPALVLLGVVSCVAARAASFADLCTLPGADAPDVHILASPSLVGEWSWSRIEPQSSPAALSTKISPAVEIDKGSLSRALATLSASIGFPPPVLDSLSVSVEVPRLLVVDGTLGEVLSTLGAVLGPSVHLSVSGDPPVIRAVSPPWVEIDVPAPAVPAFAALVSGLGGRLLHHIDGGPLRVGLSGPDVKRSAAAIRAFSDLPAYALLELELVHPPDATALWADLVSHADRHRYGSQGAELLVWPTGSLPPQALAAMSDVGQRSVRRVPVAPGFSSSVPLELRPCDHRLPIVSPRAPRIVFSTVSVSADAFTLEIALPDGGMSLNSSLPPGAFIALRPPSVAEVSALLWGRVRIVARRSL